MVVRRTGEAERSREGFADEVSYGSEHRDTAVHDLRFAIALDFVERDAVLGESERIEVSGGSDDAGQAVTRTRVLGDPTVDWRYDRRRWLGDVGGDVDDALVRGAKGGDRR